MKPLQQQLERYLPNRPAYWQLDSSERWALRAACRDHDPELFAIHPQAPAYMQRTVAAAKAICASCPVRQQCLNDALERGDTGVWGGTTEQERRRLRVAA